MSESVASFRKTLIAASVVAMLACASLAAVLFVLHGLVAELLGATAAVIALVGLGVVACGIVVFRRLRRLETGASDLFMDLNRKRAAEALLAKAPAGFLRRALARLVLGHDYIVGEEVEIRSLEEIRATLDPNGEIDGLPFMPEMARFCGRRARVYRIADKIYDYGKTKRMRRLDDAVLLTALRCDGAAHGGCQAQCLFLWKSKWLRRPGDAASTQATPPVLTSLPVFGTTSDGDRFVCQFTELQRASAEFSRFDPGKTLRPLIGGNVTLAAFLVATATRWFNAAQGLRGGAIFPPIQAAQAPAHEESSSGIAAGDVVVVRPLPEIERTLNRWNKNRGLWFDADMVRHCGRRLRVQGRIDRILDAATGRMLEMKSPCIVLDGVECSGEYQWFGAQHEYLYWREVWLKKDEVSRAS